MSGKLPFDAIRPSEHVLDERDRFLEAVEEHRKSRSVLLESRETEVQKASQPPARLSRALKWRLGLQDTAARTRELQVFYVYVHRHPTTESVFYVGKGVDARAWEMLSRVPEHTTVLYELLKEGHRPGSWVSIVKWGLTESEALKLEDDLIRDCVLKGVELVNRKKPIGPIATLDVPPVTKDLILRINSILASQPPEVSYLSLWEFLSRLKVKRGKREEVVEQIKQAFALGIRRWYLDDYLYIRRNYETPP